MELDSLTEATNGPNGGHDHLHKNYSRQFLQDWYAQVLSQLEIPYMVGDKQVLGFRYGSDEVNVSLG